MARPLTPLQLTWNKDGQLPTGQVVRKGTEATGHVFHKSELGFTFRGFSYSIEEARAIRDWLNKLIEDADNGV